MASGRSRLLAVAVVLAFIVGALLIVGLALHVGASVIERRVGLDAIVIELETWSRSVPGLEGVSIRQESSNPPVIVLEGEAASGPDLDRLLDRLQDPAWERVAFRVEVTVATDDEPKPGPDDRGLQGSGSADRAGQE